MSLSPSPKKWQFWIDRGGTFTDIVAHHPDHPIITHKLLSDNPPHYQDAAIQGIRDLLNQAGHPLPPNQPLPAQHIAAIKMGTTVATNALLERQGEPTLLAITHGFADALRIGYQARPNLFTLNIQLPPMLYTATIEIEERINAHGKTLIPLNTTTAKRDLTRLHKQGYRAIAIVLMHGYRHHHHETQLAELARTVGFTQISVSHQVSPLMKLVSRGDTTVVDAYLSPILRRYVHQIAAQLPDLKTHGGRLMFMRSSGGLTDANFFQGKDAVLSGPAGGVVGMARIAEAAGYPRIIGFDMGGTSTDVSRYHATPDTGHTTHGAFERTFETQVAGVRLRAPMLLIHTVAAGGGSILHFDGARYRVGPASAGAHPGPTCYRNRGPLTITDCNVMLGKLHPDFFPKVFGPTADQPLDAAAVEHAFTALAQSIQTQTGDHRAPEAVAQGFLDIAVDNMANAIKKISVQRGYDASEYTLCCFGGAAGQHACLVADALAIPRILIHPHAGVLSAYGMGLADTVVERQQAIEAPLTTALLTTLTAQLDTLQQAATAELKAQGETDAALHFRQLLHLRYTGSDTALIVNHATLPEITAAFEHQHRLRFGFITPQTPLIVEAIEAITIATTTTVATTTDDIVDTSTTVVTTDDIVTTSAPTATHPCHMSGTWHPTPFHHRDSLPVDTVIPGPAVILDPTSAIVVEPGWGARRASDHNLILERREPRPTTRAIGTDVDPVMLEIFNNLFMSVAEQMGTVLENTASSVNIKERLDFSCAIFSPDGSLVANAPHMPVHLGSMAESIKTVLRERADTIRPGDAYILNAPYNGGTHLPDVTIIKPVFTPTPTNDTINTNTTDTPTLLFFVASRGHHADIGGKTPGSAPADSTTIHEEGVVIDNFTLVDQGIFREPEIHALLTAGRWPARNPAMNIADFKAQLAACEKGAQELLTLTAHYGIATVHAYMHHVQANAEESVRRVLATLTGGTFAYAMDDGSRIQVAITVDQTARQATIDFTGTSPQHPGNMNAPEAVVRAAVLYVFRCLVADDIPLNEGCLKPLNLIIPRPSMISPRHPAAVIAGNVETSQYLVDALFGALKTAAASQGTMNNLIWGNADHQYYETICGGAGATSTASGADAVHTHMTNSRLTDPEVLEWRFPVLLESFAIRQASGGSGHHLGGNGVTRRIRFLEPSTVNIISSHRTVPPYGMAGGHPGSVGHNQVDHPDGTVTELAGVDQIEVTPNDLLTIKTPGGGGYGPPA